MKLEILTPEQRQVCYKSHLSGPTEQEGDLLTVIGELTNLVDVERARRIKAEEVVDAIHDRTPNRPDTFFKAVTLAMEYRAQYPRVETK